MVVTLRRLSAFLVGAATLAAMPVRAQTGDAAPADGIVMAPQPWGVDLQQAHSPLAAQEHTLNLIVSGLMTAVVVFVAGLLAYTLWRFNAKRNPTPSKVSHHTWLEVTWTLAPVLILVIIAIPSFRLIYFADRTPDADMTIKVTGHQWYWEYGYPDSDNLHFESRFTPDDQLKPGQLRLLTVDNQLVLPVGKKVRILTTSADVIHSFFIPSLGEQRYAIPGRTIETWVEIDQPGVYLGQCNQICGTDHSRMPISIRAVTPEQFQAWLVQAKTQFSDAGGAKPDRFAAAAR